MENNEIPKIITKRSSRIRFTISNSLGGIGLTEIIIFIIALILISVTLIFLPRVSLWATIILSLSLFIFFLMLVFPTPTGDKLWYVLFISFIFIFKNKSFDIKEEIKIIKNNLIKKSANYGVAFKIKASDLTLASQSERTPILNELGKIIQLITLDFEIIKIDVPYDYSLQKRYLQQQIKNCSIKTKLHQLENQLELIENLEHGNNTKISHFLVVYDKDYKNLQRKLRPILINNNNFEFVEASEFETNLLVNQMICPVKINKQIKKGKAKQFKNYLQIKDKYITYLTVNEYPFLVNDGWLSGFNYSNINYSIKCFNLSQSESLKLLDKAIQRAEIQEVKKASENNLIENYMDHFHNLIDLIQQTNQTLKMVNIMFTITGNSKKELDENKSGLISELNKNNIIVNQLNYLQLQAYENEIDWNKKLKVLWQEMAPITLSASWPFITTPLTDEKGIILGTNELDEPIVFDIKHRDITRNSSNCFILGSIGSGKTFCVKKQINWLYANGTKIFIIDPEREYTKLLEYYQGQNIIMGRADSRINPLEIFTDNFVEHLSNLLQWFIDLYPDLQTVDQAKLESLINTLYLKFNISELSNYANMTPTDFPTLKNLFELIEKEEKKKTIKSKVYSALWMAANGVNGKIFNGITTLDLKSDFIIFDTNEITKNKTIANAQQYLMLAFLDKKVRENKVKNSFVPENKKEWICIAIDEAHTMIKEENLLALNFLANLAKRIRKYAGILYLITQNVNDFIGTEAIKTQSQAIINSCQFQFIHRLRGTDLKDYDDLIAPTGRLNEHEMAVLSTDRVGLSLFVLNNNRQILQTQATVLEQRIF